VSKWLGKVFEIQKRSNDDYDDNNARILMGGIAGIKRKSFVESTE
jgi:hypothetical protein